MILLAIDPGLRKLGMSLCEGHEGPFLALINDSDGYLGSTVHVEPAPPTEDRR